MEIIVARYCGFCFGVKRAVKTAEQTLTKSKHLVYSLGELIHNPQVVEDLASKGLKVINGLDGLSQGTLMIRCHGATPDLINEAKKKGLVVVDATCPFVKVSQRIAQSLKEQGYGIIIVGEEKHPEIVSVCGFAGDGALIVDDPGHVDSIVARFRRIGVIAQTTHSRENYLAVVSRLLLKHRFSEVRVFDTICPDSAKRQDAVSDLARRCDVMFIVGGKMSANTRRLAQICRSLGCEVYHVEKADEVQPEWVEGKDRIGVASGSSTPDWIIEGVTERIKDLSEVKAGMRGGRFTKTEGGSY
jgi:4-hydroxy-3-methylbut-2-enyl diphosphate reductase